MDLRVGSLVDCGDDGFAVLAADGGLTPHPVPDGQRAELRALLGLRDTLLALRRAESAADPGADVLRQQLNERYDAYAETFGAINRFSVRRRAWVATAEFRPPQGGFGTDPAAADVRALEVFDRSRNSATKADVFAARPEGGAGPPR